MYVHNPKNINDQQISFHVLIFSFFIIFLVFNIYFSKEYHLYKPPINNVTLSFTIMINFMKKNCLASNKFCK